MNDASDDDRKARAQAQKDRERAQAEERKAKALRDNLRRRKSAVKARAAKPD